MKITRLFSLMFLWGLMLVSCGEAPVEKKPAAKAPQPVVESACQLTMGWDPWEPYQYLTPEDEVRGLEIELVKAIAEQAGCRIDFVQKSWMKLLHDIRSGKIDLVAGASKTELREKFAYFSDEYRDESFILYVRAGETEKYRDQSLKELLKGDYKLGVTEDYIYGDQVNALQDDPSLATKFIYVPTTEVNYYNLLQNQIDGFLEDPFVAAFTIKRKGLQGQIEAHPIQVHSGNVSLMFSKKSVDKKTVQAFNQGLAKIRENGTYQNILAKYRH